MILNECDGTVLAVKSGVTNRNQALRAPQQLDDAGIRAPGVVLHKIGTRKSGYGYGHGMRDDNDRNDGYEEKK